MSTKEFESNERVSKLAYQGERLASRIKKCRTLQDIEKIVLIDYRSRL